MKILKFETIGGRKYQVKFSEQAFLDYIIHCFNNAPLRNEIAIYINNVHSTKLYSVPFDSCAPESIKCNFSHNLIKKFEFIADAEKFNL